ncbi:MAG: SDR family oxidoreductase [Elusimicrobiota bacterium]
MSDGADGKTAVVTGGAGFIGSHLVDRLLAEGCLVRVIDNFSTGRPENLEHVRGHEGLAVHEADICDAAAIRPLFTGADWVFHIAALADIVPSIENPQKYFNSNVVGTQNVLEAARGAGIQRFVYAASSSCYGIPDAYPTREDAAIRPQYPYALTKYLGEELVRHWGQVYKLPIASLRFFNVYGPRSRTSGTYGAVFGVFLAQKLKGRPYTVVGDGEQTRDFTYVTDVVDAVYTAARHEQAAGQVFNVGSGSTYSVNRLVELLDGEVVHIPKRPGEPDCTFADIAKIRDRLGWRATVSFEDGVAKMLENIDYWREAPVWTENSIEKATEKWFQYLSPESGAVEGKK